QQYHRRIAEVLTIHFPDTVATQPEVLAQHYTEAGLVPPAIAHWQQAGHYASDRSAYLEAISHLSTGIELLKTLPETPEHTQQALTLQLALSVALQVVKGQAAPEVERAYTQAYALCQQVGETPALAPILFGLWRFYLGRAQFYTARELGERLLHLVQQVHDPALAGIAHFALGALQFSQGVPLAARMHLEEAVACYTSDQRYAPLSRLGQDPGVSCRAYAAYTCWLLGYPDQALVHMHHALAFAHELAHPFSLAYAGACAAIVSQMRRDVAAVLEQAEITMALSTTQGFPLWVALSTSLRGWALTMQGQSEEGLARSHEGIAAWR